MNTGWLNWYWPLGLLIVAAIMFGLPEFLALHFGGETFSRFMSRANNNGPFGRLWLIAWGILVGGLCVHFTGWCVAQ